jgi:hypothetical protein
LLDKIAGWQRQGRALDSGYAQSPQAYREIAERPARKIHLTGCAYPAEDCRCEKIALGSAGRHRKPSGDSGA